MPLICNKICACSCKRTAKNLSKQKNNKRIISSLHAAVCLSILCNLVNGCSGILNFVLYHLLSWSIQNLSYGIGLVHIYKIVIVNNMCLLNELVLKVQGFCYSYYPFILLLLVCKSTQYVHIGFFQLTQLKYFNNMPINVTLYYNSSYIIEVT